MEGETTGVHLTFFIPHLSSLIPKLDSTATHFENEGVHAPNGTHRHKNARHQGDAGHDGVQNINKGGEAVQGLQRPGSSPATTSRIDSDNVVSVAKRTT